MTENAVGALVRRAAGAVADEQLAALLQHAGTELLAAGTNRARLLDALGRLEAVHPGGLVDDPVHGALFRQGVLSALAAVGRALLEDEPSRSNPASTASDAVARLAAELSSKANRLEIFRALAQSVHRPGELVDATGLKDMQVHRVLDWAMSNGLLLRWAGEGSTHYRLSSRGEAVLEAVDEPAWLPRATALVRAAVRQRLLAAPQGPEAYDRHARPATPRTGLSLHQTVRSLAQISRALEPADTSFLAAALSVHADGERKISISPPEPLAEASPRPGEGGMFAGRSSGQPWDSGFEGSRLQALSESLVVRSTDRAGIASATLGELLSQNYRVEGGHLPLGSPIISIGGGNTNLVTSGLLLEYDVPVGFPADSPVLSWRGQSLGQDPGHEYGVLVRILDERTRVSHFVLAGLRPAGTYAACRYFHDNVERLLERFPDTSFGALLNVNRAETPRNKQPIVEALGHLQTPADEHTGLLDGRHFGLLPRLASVFERPGGPADLHVKVRAMCSDRHLDGGAAVVQKLFATIADPSVSPTRRARNVVLVFQKFGMSRDDLEQLLRRCQEAPRHARVQRATVGAYE
jgi:hypothetical protein